YDGRFDEAEAFRRNEALARGEERARKPAEHRADREGGELGVAGVDAERTAGDLIFTQRFPRAADRQSTQAHRINVGDECEQVDDVVEIDEETERVIGEAED